MSARRAAIRCERLQRNKVEKKKGIARDRAGGSSRSRHKYNFFRNISREN